MSASWLDFTAIAAGVVAVLGGTMLGIYALHKLVQVARYSWQRLHGGGGSLAARLAYAALFLVAAGLLLAVLFVLPKRLSQRH